MSYVEAVYATIAGNLANKERERAVVYVDDRVRPPGTVNAGEHQVQVSYPHLLAFVDLDPGANWMHACRYLVINMDNQEATTVESDRPPVFGILPSSWKIVMRPVGLEEWKTLPIEASSNVQPE